MHKLIISPVGTSLLTNAADEINRKLLFKYANEKVSNVTEELKEKTMKIQDSICNKLNSDISLQDLKKMSAELNSLLSIYGNNLQGKDNDIHFLIATDTYLGDITANIIKEYLSKYFKVVQIIVPEKLSTKSKADFQAGVSDLLKWCDNTLSGYRRSGYETTFNLTGGFKSLQGYLNTIGMFYADKIVYIFETSSELISIPRLPIIIDDRIFIDSAAVFLQLSQTNVGIDKSLVHGIPDIMIEEYDNNKFVLSNWGELSWNKVKEKILKSTLIPLPYISYMESFKNDFAKTDRSSEKVKLQETVAKVSCILLENQGDISKLKAGQSGGLLYANYSGINAAIGHFRINEGIRVSCKYEGEVLTLRHFGAHDYVNDNP